MRRTKAPQKRATQEKTTEERLAAMDEHHWKGPLRTVVHELPLPVFQGWTIDWGRRECRRHDPEQGPIVFGFDTPEGKALLAGWMEETYCLPKGVSVRDP